MESLSALNYWISLNKTRLNIILGYLFEVHNKTNFLEIYNDLTKNIIFDIYYYLSTNKND